MLPRCADCWHVRYNHDKVKDMDELLSVWDFLVDVICMMPPLKQVGWPSPPDFVAPVLCFGCVALLVVGVVMRHIGPPHGFGAVVLGIVVVLLMLIALAGTDTSVFKSIFILCYPSMVISFRFVEGMLIGGSIPKKTRPWQIVSVVFLSVVLYFILRRARHDCQVWFVTAWSVFGILAASVKWTQIISKVEGCSFSTPLEFVALLGIFGATLLYVQTAPLEKEFFKWVFPVGVVVGFRWRKRGVFQKTAGAPTSQQTP